MVNSIYSLFHFILSDGLLRGEALAPSPSPPQCSSAPSEGPHFIIILGPRLGRSSSASPAGREWSSAGAAPSRVRLPGGPGSPVVRFASSSSLFINCRSHLKLLLLSINMNHYSIHPPCPNTLSICFHLFQGEWSTILILMFPLQHNKTTFVLSCKNR